MKVLITGANGLLGQKLVALFQEDPNIHVVATGKGPNRNKPGNYRYAPMDITSYKSVESIMGMVTPDVVINTAAMTNVDQCEMEKEACWELNVKAVEYLMQTCMSNNSFLIHLSTDFIFDGENGPYDEEDVPNPLSHYAKSKLEAERILEKSYIKWAVVRTMLVYGVVEDMSRSNIILWVKESLEGGKQINVVDDQWRTPTLAEDLAKGVALVAKQRAEGIFHVSGKDTLTPYEMASRTAAFFMLDGKLIQKVDGSVFTQAAKRPARTGFILDKAREVLGYEPLSFNEGLRIVRDQLLQKKDE
ncbi:MAG: SDR family oxidoreductase [Bacteroidota bacterium]